MVTARQAWGYGVVLRKGSGARQVMNNLSHVSLVVVESSILYRFNDAKEPLNENRYVLETVY
jgi:hypothetical protein